jgi:hypothetical protein
MWSGVGLPHHELSLSHLTTPTVPPRQASQNCDKGSCVNPQKQLSSQSFMTLNFKALHATRAAQTCFCLIWLNQFVVWGP